MNTKYEMESESLNKRAVNPVDAVRRAQIASDSERKKYDLSIVIITSPTPSMPSTDLLSACIHSFENIAGLETCPIIIVMDGYQIATMNRTKKGKVTTEYAAAYDLYHEAILKAFTGDRFHVVRSEKHLGFAFAVKLGLEQCTTTFALIAQHDRVFYRFPDHVLDDDCHGHIEGSNSSGNEGLFRNRPIKQQMQIQSQIKYSGRACHEQQHYISSTRSECNGRFLRLHELLIAMEADPSIRYIGFPTSSSIKHDKLLATNYNLNLLNKNNVKKYLGGNLYLQPLIFWFDSQHLCHIERYLEIYSPLRNMPEDLRNVVGWSVLRDMLLRPGDFIEDRLGQAQRKQLVNMASQLSRRSNIEHNVGDSVKKDERIMEVAVTEDLIVRVFKWFGTYLCWPCTSDCPYDVQLSMQRSEANVVVMVGHLKGRQLNPTRIQDKINDLQKQGHYMSDESYNQASETMESLHINTISSTSGNSPDEDIDYSNLTAMFTSEES